MSVKFQPDQYRSVTPYLVIDGASQAIDFYTQAFGAKESMRMPMPGGKVGHAELRIGDTVIMLADECPQMEFRGPKAFGGSAVSLLIYVENADATTAKAIELGAEVLRPIANQFYGDRSATVRDPFGHVWTIATHVEDVSAEELARRAAAMGK